MKIKKTYFLLAENEKEMNLWIKAIQERIDKFSFA